MLSLSIILVYFVFMLVTHNLGNGAYTLKVLMEQNCTDFKHQRRKITILSCQKCIILRSVDKMNSLSNIVKNFAPKCLLSKRYF
jgi:hypothetical protein